MIMAQEEARQLGHGAVDAQHLLLGVLRMDQGGVGRALESFGITPERVRDQVMRIVGPGEETPSGKLELTSRAEKALERAQREAVSLGHHHVGSEHVLLGLLPPPSRARLTFRDRGGGVIAQILLELETDVEEVRVEVLRVIGAPAEG